MPPRPGPALPVPTEPSHATRGAPVSISSLQKGKLEEPKPSQNGPPPRSRGQEVPLSLAGHPHHLALTEPTQEKAPEGKHLASFPGERAGSFMAGRTQGSRSPRGSPGVHLSAAPTKASARGFARE